MRSMFASFADLSRIFHARLFIIAIVLTFALPAYCDAKSIARQEIPVELREANGQDMQSSAAPLSSLRGAVINSVTREPVARALVFSPDNRFAIFTDDQGRFEFPLSRIDS